MDYQRRHDRDDPRGWFSLFVRLGGWASLILGVLLLVATLISAIQLAIADRMDTEGRFTSAVVVGKRVSVSTEHGATRGTRSTTDLWTKSAFGTVC